MPEKTTLAILASHKVGHVMTCTGVAQALGITPQMRPVAPRKLFHLLAPWGPHDPRDNSDRPDAALRAPFPDIAFASGRETVPYLRALKKLSGGRTFTVYFGDPRTSRSLFDLVCVPEHDRLRGPNIIATLTPPHPRSETARAAARENPDSRLTQLATPRIAMLIGGPSGNYKFEPVDIAAIAAIAKDILSSGASLMISPSRRTPPALMDAIAQAVGAPAAQSSRLFIWDGRGDNPYLAMLALADAFVVTADSVNMISECIATGRPIHIYETSGDAGKFSHFFNELLKKSVLRPWAGRIEEWRYEPLDSTPVLAREIAARYAAFITKRP